MADAGKDGAAAEPAAGAGLSGAAERLRQAARWLVAAFGAVAAAVFAGISLSSFGSLDPATAPDLFLVAVLGVGAALAGTLVALVTAMSLALASTISLAELARRSDDQGSALAVAQEAVEQDPILAPWDRNVGAFVEALRTANEEYLAELDAWQADEALNASEVMLGRAVTRLDHLHRLQRTVLETASYVRLQARFQSARWVFGISLAVAAAGAVAFTWATSAPAAADVPVAATQATWRVPDADRARVTAAMGGAACTADPDRLAVVVIGSTGEGAEQQLEIVTVPTPVCTPVRLSVARAQVSRTAA